MTIETRAQTLTKAVCDVLLKHMSMGQVQAVAADIEAAITSKASDLDAVEVEANAHSASLGQKFQALLGAMMPKGCPEKQALFAQGFYLGGAHSALQILAHAQTLPPEESLIVWKNLQSEIKAASPKRENVVELPPEKRLIV